jgi:hypothetical protein
MEAVVDKQVYPHQPILVAVAVALETVCLQAATVAQVLS